MGNQVEIKKATKGDLVPVLTPEFDVVNDGKGLRVWEIDPAGKTYGREGLTALKAQRERELVNINILLAMMDELGVE